MTYLELLERLNKLSQDQLEDYVTVCLEGEYLPIHSTNIISNDILGEDYPILEIL